MLVSAVQWNESAICIDTSPPSWNAPTPRPRPFKVITEHWAELPVLHSSFLLAISFTHGSVYVSTTLNSSHPLFPHCFHKCILYVCIFIPALLIGSAVPVPYRLHIYVLKYDTCFSDLLHSVTVPFSSLCNKVIFFLFTQQIIVWFRNNSFNNWCSYIL